MERVWLSHYPKGVPADIDPDRYTSLVQMLEESFQKFASRPAFTGLGRTLAYAELDELSRCFGAWLQARGLRAGERVAVMLPNVLAYPVVAAAILRAGGVVVNVNPLYTPRELEQQLKDSGARAIVILENFASTLEQVLARTPVEHVVLATMGDLLGSLKGALVNFVVRKRRRLVPAYSLPAATAFTAALAEGRRLALAPTTSTPADVAVLQYTGGTTGVSKGATLTHRNLIANVLQSEAWTQPALEHPRTGRVPEQINTVVALPLYHIFAFKVCFLLVLRLGGRGLLIPNPRDIPGTIKALRGQKLHVFPAVNTLYNALLNDPGFSTLDTSGLLVSNGGGMAVQKTVAERWLAATGCPIVEGYGLSETSPVLTCNPVDNTTFTGTIGLPLPSTWIAIRDEHGRDLPFGEPGEICAKGPQVMAGYWQRPDETARVMTADGFFRTGDIGVMDERGYVRIVDRKKDMIIVSGFNVYPNEVEEVIAACPGVLECAVIGVTDDKSGEAVKAFVVRKDPALTEQTVRDWCEANLAGYKRPRHIVFRADLPKTPVGKILRRELREQEKRPR